MKNILEYKGYHAKIEFSSDDNIFIGSVIGINDSLNFHGTTVDELKEQFKICIDDYLEMCEFFKKKPEKAYRGSFNIRIPSELHKKLDLLAVSQETSINNLVVQAINEFFNEESRKEIIKETVYVMPLPVSKPQKILSDDKFSFNNTYIQNESTVKSFSLNYN